MFKNKKTYVIELDGSIYVCTENRLEVIPDLSPLNGETWLISDMGGAISRMMIVEAPPKYADVVIKKRLQESGEFDEPIEVIVNRKSKKGHNTTEVFFTALPSRLFYRYFDDIKDYSDGLLLFPISSVLYKVVKKTRSKGPVAVVFRHSRFADILIGTSKRLYHADQRTAFDQSREQINSLWEMIREDIRIVEQENRIKVSQVILLNWTDSIEEPDWPDEGGPLLYSMDTENWFLDNQRYDFSFISSLRFLSCLDAISPTMEKTCHYLKRSVPFLNVVIFLLISFLIWGHIWFSRQAEDLAVYNQALNDRIYKLRQVYIAPEIPFRKTLDLLKDISYSRKTPSFKKIVRDVSRSLFSGMMIDVFKVHYTEREIQIELFGKIIGDFASAHNGYTGFINRIKGRGYKVRKHTFNTDIMESDFLVKISMRLS
ncbi:MAG: hypothetical protein SV375_08235 [Thermodesulfobacteriota bacterium]|nr:hypothetical protein [Thermodesulfobacteriota bacterium]